MKIKQYKVEEIHCGCCTGTIRGPVVERLINKMEKQGYKYEGQESVIGRKCCAPDYTLLVIFSYDSNEESEKV